MSKKISLNAEDKETAATLVVLNYGHKPKEYYYVCDSLAPMMYFICDSYEEALEESRGAPIYERDVSEWRVAVKPEQS